MNGVGSFVVQSFTINGVPHYFTNIGHIYRKQGKSQRFEDENFKNFICYNWPLVFREGHS